MASTFVISRCARDRHFPFVSHSAPNCAILYFEMLGDILLERFSSMIAMKIINFFIKEENIDLHIQKVTSFKLDL
jgi:hypothetical protein